MPLPPAPRLVVLDLARTAAVIGMVIFHFTFDLAMFGHIAPETLYQPFWYYFARMVAGSFLFLSGFSLWIAHRHGIRWPAFWRRFAKVAGAAVLVSVASIWVTPGGLIYFGILHALAAASLIGLLVLRLPAAVTLAIAAAVFVLPRIAIGPQFDGVWLLWLGLADSRPQMADYVPLLPWLAPCLAGVAVAKLAEGALPRLARRPSPVLTALGFPGRHSLIIYLAHQPIMIAGFTAYARLTTG